MRDNKVQLHRYRQQLYLIIRKSDIKVFLNLEVNQGLKKIIYELFFQQYQVPLPSACNV